MSDEQNGTTPANPLAPTPPARKTAEILLIYHAGCHDGFCCAWIANRKYGPHCEYLPMSHADAPAFDAARCEGRLVIIADFSFPPERLVEIASHAKRVVLLDHHKSAAESLGETPDSDQRKALAAAMDAAGVEPGRLDVTVDQSKSGAHLAWRHFHGNAQVPWLVLYTEDRDLWLWRLPGSRQVNAALRAYDTTFEMWDKLDREVNTRHLMMEGAAILMAQQRIIERQAAEARAEEIGGHVVPCANCTALVSETLELMSKGHPFAASWRVDSEERKHWSLRSDFPAPGAVDVSLVAAQYGGGGHPGVAGFTEPAPAQEGAAAGA